MIADFQSHLVEDHSLLFKIFQLYGHIIPDVHVRGHGTSGDHKP